MSAHKLSIAVDIETEQEADGRWIAEVPSEPGIVCYGKTEKLAIRYVTLLFLNNQIHQITQEHIGELSR